MKIQRGPYVDAEWLQWRRGSRGKPFRFLDFQAGAGRVIAGETPNEGDTFQVFVARLKSSRGGTKNESI